MAGGPFRRRLVGFCQEKTVRQSKSIGLPYVQIMMRHDNVMGPLRRRGSAPGAMLMGAGAAWLLILARLSFTWHVHYRQTVLALSTLQQAERVTSPALRGRLLQYAASLLGVPLPHAALGVSHLSNVAMRTMDHLVSTEWFISPALWVLGFVIMGVALYWMKEGRLAALEAERALLKDQLLAIARGWASLATTSDSRQVVQNILSELAQHTNVTSAAIYRLTPVNSDALKRYASLGELSLSDGPIPRLFLEPDRGLVGEALAANQPRYSGDYAESGYLVPGVRMPRVAVFPARYHDQNWGILLLSSTQPRWFFTYREVLEVLAQEVALAAASADMAAESRRHQLIEERARMQSDILANVSHELRTPLGLVKGYLETLQASSQQMSPQDRQDFLNIAVQETGELEALIDQLLTMSQMESADVPHQPRWFAVERWIAQSLDRHPAWDRERVRVKVSGNLDWVFGDARHLTTVLSGLLENALKYSSKAVEVQVEAAPRSWGFQVRDYGPGIDPDAAERIFERFYRAPVHAQSEIRGSGLGLSIAKRIVAKHGGTIKARNASGGGLIMDVRLPQGGDEHGEERADGRRWIDSGH